MSRSIAVAACRFDNMSCSIAVAACRFMLKTTTISILAMSLFCKPTARCRTILHQMIGPLTIETNFFLGVWQTARFTTPFANPLSVKRTVTSWALSNTMFSNHSTIVAFPTLGNFVQIATFLGKASTYAQVIFAKFIRLF